MKYYASIPGPSNAPKEHCYAFVKYDGSNIRAEWSKKQGWYKFGTRNQLLDRNNPIFGSCADLFLNKYGDSLPKVFKKDSLFSGVTNVVVFAEWFGAKTFTGRHVPNDPKDIVLFDVNPMKKGLLNPRQFLDSFGHLDVAELVYSGEFNSDFVTSIREEQIDITSKFKIANEIPEGVVCKGGTRHNLWMCKIKTHRYKEELKKIYDQDWAKYWEE